MTFRPASRAPKTAFSGSFCEGVFRTLITDYDVDYLYLFKKTSPEQIPLVSFYKLQEGNRGYWHLHYYGEQSCKKKLTIRPLGKGDASSMHSFIEAI